ncbi:hypothetical protein ACFL58_03950 [Elusimicrobiota bacterium]
MAKIKIDLNSLSDEDLLKIRLCDFTLQIKGTWLENCISKLYNELNDKGIKFHPTCYLADEWLAPEHEPVVGIAFYLAHPKLIQIENRMMREVEGGNEDSCMRLLRHETGHAINYAYQFYKKKFWRQLFGHFSSEYPDRYKYRPYSKSFVIHLGDYYAQYHPDEDFAETFAVWLDPNSDWANKYQNWKALEKLNYVDKLMKDVASKDPKQKTGKKYWNVSKIKTSLENHYKKKIDFYAEESPDFHDSHLKKIFSNTSGETIDAHKAIHKHKKDILANVSFWTGEKKYFINRLLKSIVKRSRELQLKNSTKDTSYILKLTTYITASIMNYAYTGSFKRKK